MFKTWKVFLLYLKIKKLHFADADAGRIAGTTVL